MRASFTVILLSVLIASCTHATIFEFAPSVGYDSTPGTVSYGGSLDFNLSRFVISVRGNYLRPENDGNDLWRYKHFNAGASIGYLFRKPETGITAITGGVDYFGSRRDVGAGVDTGGYIETEGYLRLSHRVLLTVGYRIGNFGFNDGGSFLLTTGAGMTAVRQRGSYSESGESESGGWTFTESLAGKDLTLDIVTGFELTQKIAGFFGVTSTCEMDFKFMKNDGGPLGADPPIEFRIYLGPSFYF